MERSSKHLDNVIGPLVVAFGLIFGLIINFVYGFRAIALQKADGFTAAGLSDDFYTKNPTQKKILDIVFYLVGAQTWSVHL